MRKTIPTILLLVSLGLFAFTMRDTASKIGRTFPGYLTFENGVIGAFYVSDWSGHKSGLTYHQMAPETPSTQEQVFSKKDFVVVSLLPAISGLLFVLLGLCIFYYLPGVLGRYPLFAFHLLAGNYLILCPDFHLTYHFSYVVIGCFAFIPATVIHFALLFPEEHRMTKANRWIYGLSYALSLFIVIPYIAFFHNPQLWMKIEFVAFAYLIFSYFFWLLRLDRTNRKPQLEFNRIIARYILLGQIVAFAIPLIFGVAIFAGSFSFPLNLAAPLSILFPISLFMGVILGRLRQSQMQLVQSEKNAALGNLLAGLAHEINNPMTFIYSAIEPLKDSLNAMWTTTDKAQHEKEMKNVQELVDIMEEGATRAKSIIESFRYFSHPDQNEKKSIDLHEIIDQSLRLLQPKWKDRIRIVKNYGNIPLVRSQPTELGQVLINILSNACYAIAKDGTIEISTSIKQEYVVVKIRDDGMGMNKEILSKIFDPFFTTKNQGEGTGLGLAITLQLVKKNGGTIEASSEPGKGTTITIGLPV
jgi:signal transduction histidine kinase